MKEETTNKIIDTSMIIGQNIIANFDSPSGIIKGILADIFDISIKTPTEKKTKKFMGDTILRLSEIENFIDKVKDESWFAPLFIKAVRSVQSSIREEKIELIKNAVVNSVSGDFKIEEKEFFMSILDQLSFEHLKLIAILHDIKKYLETHDNSYLSQLESNARYSMPQNSTGQILLKLLNLDEYEISMLEIFILDLKRFGFLDSSFSLNGGLAMNRDNLQSKTTKIGKRFVQFIIDKK